MDVREKALIRQFELHGTKGRKVRELHVGDASCTHNAAHGWLVERKSAADFVASICDGRCAEQRGRLFETHYQVVFIVEGDLRGDQGGRDLKWHQSLLSAIVGPNAGDRARAYRTVDVKETFDLICVLVRELDKLRAQVPSGLSPPKVASKRQRGASPSRSHVRPARRRRADCMA